MEARGVILVSLLVASLAQTCHGNVLFSSLQRTLVVDGSAKTGEVLKAGEDRITVTWSLNGSYSGKDSDFKTVKVKLCYAPVSQKDRGWRKTVDNLAKDKTCPHLIVAKPYSSNTTSYEWLIEKDVPQATYFIRAYAINAEGQQVGFGQTTNKEKTANLFAVNAITGRHTSLDVASICFSAFSILSLAGFFIAEKKKAKKSSPPPPHM